MLQAIARWRPDPREVEFRIGGDGPMRIAYMAMTKNLGIADRVNWLGSVSRQDAPRLFGECHAYVMPSRHETFGVVYAEAIASGKPIIATRSGGPEFIVNEINGRLVEIGDIDELANTMAWMRDNWRYFDPQLIRKDFEQRFSRSAVISQLLKLYQSVLER